jgi:hypothetical protein
MKKLLNRMSRRHSIALGSLAALNEAEEHYGERQTGCWTIQGVRFYVAHFIRCNGPRML